MHSGQFLNLSLPIIYSIYTFYMQWCSIYSGRVYFSTALISASSTFSLVTPVYRLNKVPSFSIIRVGTALMPYFLASPSLSMSIFFNSTASPIHYIFKDCSLRLAGSAPFSIEIQQKKFTISVFMRFSHWQFWNDFRYISRWFCKFVDYWFYFFCIYSLIFLKSSIFIF